jgi:hypothetical protein
LFQRVISLPWRTGQVTGSPDEVGATLGQHMLLLLYHLFTLLLS